MYFCEVDSDSVITGRGVSIWPPVARIRFYAVAALAFLLIAASAISASASAEAGDPLQQTREWVQRAIAILRNPQMSLAEERLALKRMADEHFDFNDMARVTLGANWQKLTPAQRADFTRVFADFIEDVYLSQVQNYSGQNVNFISESFVSPGFAKVESSVVGDNGEPPLALTFMLKRMEGNWKIYDVTMDGISITSNYRNQFERVIANRGFDALIRDLQVKQRALAASIGNKS